MSKQERKRETICRGSFFVARVLSRYFVVKLKMFLDIFV